MAEPLEEPTELSLEMEASAELGSLSCRIADRYEILALLGAGGMGRVYRARDLELDELVALKVLSLDDASAVERFRREVKLARRVTHKNVARVFDLGEHQGTRFFTMELVDGSSLAEIVANEGPQPGARVIGWALEMCAGLAAAHGAGVIHRDLKPQNVLLARDGRVVLTDFGIARARQRPIHADEGPTRVGEVVGTPAYMAPEQLAGFDDIDARVDIWALGATLFRLLTGRSARGAGSSIAPSAQPMAYESDPRVVRHDVSEPLARIVARCLVADRAERYATADAVRADLERIAERGEIPTTAVRVVSRRAQAQPAAERRDGRALAVLPFESSAGSDDHLAAGIATEIVDAVSMNRSLRVASPGAVRARMERDRDPREVGRDLGVDVVATGSVQRDGDRVRVVVRLVGVEDGFQIWARRFDGGVGDLVRIGSEIADAVTAALATELAPQPAGRTSDRTAVELLFRARQEYRRFWTEDVVRALALYEEALARAPDDPVVLAGYAMARARRGFHGDGAGLSSSLARNAAERALAVAPHLGESHLAMAHALLASGKPDLAARSLSRAVELAPLLVDARETFGSLLVEAGAVRMGADMLRAALTLDPEHHFPHVSLGRAQALIGHWAAAYDDLLRCTHPQHARLAWVTRARLAFWTKDVSQIAALRRAAPGLDGEMAIGHGFLSLLEGNELPAAARQSLERFSVVEREDARRATLAFQIRAEMAAYQTDAPAVVALLQRASGLGLYDTLWLERCPLLSAYRDLPQLAQTRGEVAGRAHRILEAATSETID